MTQKPQRSPWSMQLIICYEPTLCMLSIKTWSVGSTISVSQTVPQAGTSCCVIDLRKRNMKCLLARKPVCSHRHWRRLRRNWSQVKALEMSTWRLERRRVAFQLARFLLGRIRLIRSKNLKNVQFTTKAVSTLQDQVKKTNFILWFWNVSTTAHIPIDFSDLFNGRVSLHNTSYIPASIALVEENGQASSYSGRRSSISIEIGKPSVISQAPWSDLSHHWREF